MKCTECGLITQKRATVKRPQCIKCGTKNKFEILENFPQSRDATAYIQKLKGQDSPLEFVIGGAEG